MKKLPRIVIIGRPNVGKSTLFNRLIGRRQALVHDEPGVTRDRIVETTRWWIRAKPMDVELTDTGGLGGDRFADEIKKQVQIALSGADAVIAVFDAQAGVTAADHDLIRQFKRAGLHRKMPFICAVNKVDAEIHEQLISEFYALDLETVLTVSAEHGRGIDDLEEAVADAIGFTPSEEISQEEFTQEEEPEETLEEEPGEDFEEELEDDLDEEDSEPQAETPRLPPAVPRIAIVGRPNVGKSTLTNALLGEERMITSPIAGTTVDAIDSLTSLGGKPYVLIDTAGIRRKNKTEQGIEVLSVVQAKKALERADLAILVLDGENGTTEQDEKIGGLIEEAGCSVILMINKWDTQRNNPKFSKEQAAERIRAKFGYLKYAPVMFVSAKERKGLKDLGDLIQEILYQRTLKLSTKEFSDWIRKESTVHNPANAKFYLCHQAGRNPPTFVCHVNDPEKIHFSLKRHLLNALRERWGFMGTPVRLLFIEGKNRRSLPNSGKAKKTKRPKRAKSSACSRC